MIIFNKNYNSSFDLQPSTEYNKQNYCSKQLKTKSIYKRKQQEQQISSLTTSNQKFLESLGFQLN